MKTSVFARVNWKFLFSIISLLTEISGFGQDVKGKVARIQDGDSFLLETSDSTYRIRLNGIDCPEINQPFGETARDFINRYLNDSITVIPIMVDKYGRTIADAFYHDTLINFLLVDYGYAWHYKKYSSDTTLANCEDKARLDGKGLWSDQDRVTPWDWRAGNYDFAKFLLADEAKVFSCIGSENPHYHNSSHCRDLSNCTSTVILLYPSEAIDVYRKTQCATCFKKNIDK